MLADWRTAPVTEKMRLTLGLLQKITRTPSEVGPADIEPLCTAGVSDQAIEDALVVGSLFHIITRLADAFEVEVPDPEGFLLTGKRLLEMGYL